MDKPRTNVYIDGFNFYYGCFRNRLHPADSAYKWLDLAAFCTSALPDHHLHRIKYFTAKVSGTPQDPQQHIRQELYLRALRTCQNPKVTVYFGHFLKTRKTGRIRPAQDGIPQLMTVEVYEEKGSDVNLATQLLIDGYEGDYEAAVIISNDSDLEGPIQATRQRLDRDAHVINPHSNISTVMKRVATTYREVPRELLATCQFPDELVDRKGRFRKPSTW